MYCLSSAIALSIASPSLAKTAPTVAVFSVEAVRVRLPRAYLNTLTGFIGAELTASGRYQVLPSSELKAALSTKKRESYRACYDEACQIEVGKELAAQLSLASKVSRIGKKCLVTLTLYNLRTSASERAATVQGGCSEEALLSSVERAVQQLTKGGKTRSRRKLGKAWGARRRIDSAQLGGDLFCAPQEAVVGAQNLRHQSGSLDMVWCQKNALVEYKLEKRRRVDSSQNGGDLMCLPGEAVCGAQNLQSSNMFLDMLWCCPVNIQLNYARRRKIDSSQNGGDLFCAENELVCGAQNFPSNNTVLDMLWCCPQKEPSEG